VAQPRPSSVFAGDVCSRATATLTSTAEIGREAMKTHYRQWQLLTDIDQYNSQLHLERGVMEISVRKLFERYESFFNRTLRGDIDMDEMASLYASDFVAASPAGVSTGKNDDQLKQIMAQGYAHYRAIGTKEMRIRDVRLSSIDELHCVAHVAWIAIYARKDQPDVAIDFDVHYFVQKRDGEPKVFGWVSGDEQALPRTHGVI
jgi:hypothetical protein